MQLYPELTINNNEIHICSICDDFLTGNNPKRPDIRMSQKYDFGNIDRINYPPMPILSLFREFVIQRVRVL